MAQTTKKRIMEGFLELLEQRPLDKISVVDVAEHCGINRNTFYYYYCDIYALIRELMETVAAQMIAVGLSDRNWTEIARQVTCFMREHRRAVNHMFHSSQRELLEDHIYEVTYAVTESLVRRTADGLPVSEEDLRTVTLYFTSALLGMIFRWLRVGMKDDAEAAVERTGYLLEGTVGLNHTQSQTEMMMNKALFIPNGNWMEGEMADAPRADGFEFGLTCAPVLDDGETRYVMSSVEQFEIPANAKNPELAKEFLRFLYTEESVKLFAEKANGIYALKKANEMVKGIVTDGVYNMNDIYQEGTFMVFGWDAMPDTSKVVIADSVFNVASDVMNGDMTAEQWRDGIEAAFEEIAASK